MMGGEIITWLNAILTTLSLFNLIVHSIGTSLLLSVYKKGDESVEMVHLINLSLVELIASLIILLDEGFELIFELINVPPHILKVLHEIDHYVFIITYVIFCVYYMAMSFITIDRCMVVMLNLRYHVYWNSVKSIYLSAMTWLLAVIVSIVTCIAYKAVEFDYQCLFSQYVFPFQTSCLSLFCLFPLNSLSLLSSPHTIE